MENGLDITLISDQRTLATALEAAPAFIRCTRIGSDALPRACTPSQSEVVLVAPSDWEQMNDWLSELAARFSSNPWLLFADPRVAGLFCTQLPGRQCTILPATATVETIRQTLYRLAAGETPLPAVALPREFAHHVAGLPGGAPDLRLTEAQFELGCAVSLHLPNAEAARVLKKTSGSVSSGIHALHVRLGIKKRRELAAFFKQVRYCL